MRTVKRIMSNIGIVLAAGVVGFAGVYGFSSDKPITNQIFAMLSNECTIKGNISINSGERIYHVPGQRYYAATRIRPEYGERWFCSELDAQAAGWRRSGV